MRQPGVPARAEVHDRAGSQQHLWGAYMCSRPADTSSRIPVSTESGAHTYVFKRQIG
jgi:hypothetical protein